MCSFFRGFGRGYIVDVFIYLAGWLMPKQLSCDNCMVLPSKLRGPFSVLELKAERPFVV